VWHTPTSQLRRCWISGTIFHPKVEGENIRCWTLNGWNPRKFMNPDFVRLRIAIHYIYSSGIGLRICWSQIALGKESTLALLCKYPKQKHKINYSWWKKSCSSWCSRYLSIHRVLYIPGGAGFLPSTVSSLYSKYGAPKLTKCGFHRNEQQQTWIQPPGSNPGENPHVYACIYVNIYNIYIYIERERENWFLSIDKSLINIYTFWTKSSLPSQRISGIPDWFPPF